MKIVQIGTGGWGKNHTRILSQLGVLVAVCDADSQKSKEYGEKYSVNHYESLDELLSSEEFDICFLLFFLKNKTILFNHGIEKRL